jgi:hypothetical protein
VHPGDERDLARFDVLAELGQGGDGELDLQQLAAAATRRGRPQHTGRRHVDERESTGRDGADRPLGGVDLVTGDGRQSGGRQSGDEGRHAPPRRERCRSRPGIDPVRVVHPARLGR